MSKQVKEFRLGRRLLRFGRRIRKDKRDRNYPIAALLRYSAAITQRFWTDTSWSGDQGSTPRCVAFAACAWIEDGPISPAYKKGKKPPFLSPGTIYREAQALDGIPMPHDGTTVRGAAKCLQKRKIIKSYHWAANAQDVVQGVLQKGPVMLGIDWYEGMMEPDANGFLLPTGEIVGGHGIECNGVDIVAGYVRLKNSWGLDWGDKGHAKLAVKDLDALIKAQGEGCLAVEIQEHQ
jgi:hypothetical protein